MIIQVLRKSTFLAVMLCTTAAGIICLSFAVTPNEQQLLDWSNKCLTYAFDASGDTKLKKWDLSLTSDAFVRLRKTYVNGKQEYYSLQLQHFKDLDYLGNTKEGMLKLQANKDYIIVQTYDDPNGNVDSMATSLDIRVKNMDPDKLDSLRQTLIYFRNKTLN